MRRIATRLAERRCEYKRMHFEPHTCAGLVALGCRLMQRGGHGPLVPGPHIGLGRDQKLHLQGGEGRASRGGEEGRVDRMGGHDRKGSKESVEEGASTRNKEFRVEGS